VILRQKVSIFIYFNCAVRVFKKIGKSLRILNYGSENYILTVENMTDGKLVFFHSRDITLIVMQPYPMLIM
jgi:hypothetical protein